MADLTPERLTALRALCEGASPAPWNVESDSELSIFCADEERPRIARVDPDRDDDEDVPEDEAESYNCDAEFIAAARDALPALLDEVERLRAEVARIRGEAERVIDARGLARKSLGVEVHLDAAIDWLKVAMEAKP